MLLDEVLKYYADQDCNCAESLLHGANDYYNLGLTDDTFHAIGGFGGGCYSGRLCGACAGSVAAISKKYIATYAHNEQKACDRVTAFVSAFQETLGSDICKELKDMYWDNETNKHCIKTVTLAAGVLQKQMDKYIAEDEAEAKEEEAKEEA